MKASLKALPLIALLAAALPPEAGAQSPEEKGLEIAREMDRRDRGWGDQRADLVMILRNPSSKSMIIFATYKSSLL